MNANYSLIVSKLLELQPKGWSSVVAYAQITEESYEIFFYSKIKEQYYKNFELEKTHCLSRAQTRACFRTIYEELLQDFQANHWYVCTIQIKSNGKFIIEYEYTDYSEKSGEYKKLWKEKYLKS